MEKVKNEIIEYLASISSVERALLFGSRARGDHKERSDIDLALVGDVSDSDVAKIRYFFAEEVGTLLKIDCVFTSKLDKSSEFYKRIKAEGIVIYEKQ